MKLFCASLALSMFFFGAAAGGVPVTMDQVGEIHAIYGSPSNVVFVHAGHAVTAEKGSPLYPGDSIDFRDASTHVDVLLNGSAQPIPVRKGLFPYVVPRYDFAQAVLNGLRDVADLIHELNDKDAGHIMASTAPLKGSNTNEANYAPLLPEGVTQVVASDVALTLPVKWQGGRAHLVLVRDDGNNEANVDLSPDAGFDYFACPPLDAAHTYTLYIGLAPRQVALVLLPQPMKRTETPEEVLGEAVQELRSGTGSHLQALSDFYRIRGNYYLPYRLLEDEVGDPGG